MGAKQGLKLILLFHFQVLYPCIQDLNFGNNSFEALFSFNLFLIVGFHFFFKSLEADCQSKLCAGELRDSFRRLSYRNVHDVFLNFFQGC
jgi:hypothetical protein